MTILQRSQSTSSRIGGGQSNILDETRIIQLSERIRLGHIPSFQYQNQFFTPTFLDNDVKQSMENVRLEKETLTETILTHDVGITTYPEVREQSVHCTLLDNIMNTENRLEDCEPNTHLIDQHTQTEPMSPDTRELIHEPIIIPQENDGLIEKNSLLAIDITNNKNITLPNMKAFESEVHRQQEIMVQPPSFCFDSPPRRLSSIMSEKQTGLLNEISDFLRQDVSICSIADDKINFNHAQYQNMSNQEFRSVEKMNWKLGSSMILEEMEQEDSSEHIHNDQ